MSRSDIEFLYEWDSQAVWEILHKMRPADAREVFAMMPSNDPADLFARLQLVQQTLAVIEIAFKPTLLGRPVGFLAVSLESPRVGRAHLIATPEMRKRDFAIWAEGIRATLPDKCRAAGLHRVHCSTMLDHKEAHLFLDACNMAPEGIEHGIGREGEDFVRWVGTLTSIEDEDERDRLRARSGFWTAMMQAQQPKEDKRCA